MKDWLEPLREAYAADWSRAKESHFAGAGGMEVVREVTALTDRLLTSVFEKVAAESGLSPKSPGWALLAVGGYGRGEQNPYSDVDIMFLKSPGGKESADSFPMAVLHVLWDLGLDLGYSVRAIEDCLPLMKRDFTIMTSLLEARRICGDENAFGAFSERVKGQGSTSMAEDYVREKLLERTRRHKKHGDSVYLREPNIKEGAGGLRDIHAALWISRVKYGAGSLESLAGKGLVRTNDLRRLTGARDYLLRLRNELHFLSGHRQDTLSFDLQERAAHDFGYRPTKHRMAVENFMRAYYLRARSVREITQSIIEKALGSPRGKRWFFLPPTKRKLDGRFYLMGRLLCMDGGPEVFEEHPEELLTAFRHSQEQGLSMSPVLKEAVSEKVRALGRVREQAEAGGIFLDILGRLDGLYDTLDLMHKMKALPRFMPEFSRISALVQYDMYHRYTVDEHSLLAVRKIQELTTAEGMAYPDFVEALRRVKDRQVLVLATLLHDVGKGAGHGHAERGARMASDAALRLGMSASRAETVASLVRNHLLMAHISQRRELTDHKVLEKFCRIIDSPELLDMLYLLTYADMSAVGPELFTEWKMMLLKELHEGAAAYLRDSSSVVAREKDRLARLRASIIAEVESKGVGDGAAVNAFLDNLPANYPLAVPAEHAVKHFEMVRALKAGEVAVHHEHDRRGYTDLTIVLHEFMGVLYISAGALAAKNMNILSAQIFTGKDGIVIDMLQVTDYNKKPALDEGLWTHVKKDLVRLLRGQARVRNLMPTQPAYPKRTALRDVPVRVEVDNEASDRYTVVEVYAPDRIGLLYDITRSLYGMGCYISSARVDTDVDQVVDVFYVTDIFRLKIEDNDRIAALKDALAAALTGGPK